EIDTSETDTSVDNEQSIVLEGESYTEAQDVVDYLDAYGELPPNYLTKKEAREPGWDAKEGDLWEVVPDASIGGDYFGNYEELLPVAEDREYSEADIKDRKSTRLNSSHVSISYAVFCLKKKNLK